MVCVQEEDWDSAPYRSISPFISAIASGGMCNIRWRLRSIESPGCCSEFEVFRTSRFAWSRACWKRATQAGALRDDVGRGSGCPEIGCPLEVVPGYILARPRNRYWGGLASDGGRCVTASLSVVYSFSLDPSLSLFPPQLFSLQFPAKLTTQPNLLSIRVL